MADWSLPRPNPATLPKSAAELQGILELNFGLAHKAKQAEIERLCAGALGRGVDSGVVETCRQVLAACDPDAEATITLTHPLEGSRRANLFEAVANILRMCPRR